MHQALIVWSLSAACAAALAGLLAPAQAQQALRLMTGPQGGVWVPLGGSMKNMWEKSIPGLQVQPLPGAGIANIRGIDEGKADIGFGNSITSVDGINGAPPYPQKVTKVCQVANLYPQYFQMVALANAGVNTVTDMKGKSIAVQPKGNTAELISQQVLKAVGLGYDSAKINFVNSYTDAASMLKDGHAQVFTLGTTIPASSVMDVAAGRDIKLVPVNDEIVTAMNKINPGYTKGVIKAGTYPKQDKDVDAVVYSAHLVGACALPADHGARDAEDDGRQPARYGGHQQGHGRADAEDDGGGHRRALPPGRDQVLQGSRRDVVAARPTELRSRRPPPEHRHALAGRHAGRGHVAVPPVGHGDGPAGGVDLPRQPSAVRAGAGVSAVPGGVARRTASGGCGASTRC